MPISRWTVQPSFPVSSWSLSLHQRQCHVSQITSSYSLVLTWIKESHPTNTCHFDNHYLTTSNLDQNCRIASNSFVFCLFYIKYKPTNLRLMLIDFLPLNGHTDDDASTFLAFIKGKKSDVKVFSWYFSSKDRHSAPLDINWNVIQLTTDINTLYLTCNQWTV